MSLLNKLRQLNEEEKFLQVIGMHETIDSSERTPEVDFEIVRACIMLTHENKELTDLLVARIESHAMNYPHSVDCNLSAGCALSILDRDGHAIPYLLKALKLDPANVKVRNLLDICCESISKPIAYRPFNERAAEVWQEFELREEELLAALYESFMQPYESARRAAELLCEIFSPVKAENIFAFIGNNGRPVLCLSSGLRKDIMFTRKQLRDFAPEGVRERWDILLSRPRSDSFAIEVNGIEIKSSDVRVKLKKSCRDWLLIVYCQKLADADGISNKDYKTLLDLLIDGTLGEINRMEWISDVHYYRKPLRGHCRTLNKAAQAIINMGGRYYKGAANYLRKSCELYNKKASVLVSVPWRQDVTTVITWLPQMQSYFSSNDVTAVEELRSIGVTAGYIIIDLPDKLRFDPGGYDDYSDLVYDDPRSVQLMELENRFEDVLHDRAGKQAVTVTGFSLGLYWLYIDFLAWDTGPVIDAIAEAAAAVGLDRVSMKTWYQASRPIMVWSAAD